MAIEDDIRSEGRRLVDAASSEGIEMRLLGGLAVLEHAGGWTPAGATRSYADIDVVIRRETRGRMGRFFKHQGYEDKEPFNSLNPSRMVFYDHERSRHVDVFVDEFEMCHRLVLRDSLSSHPLTIAVGDLLLTKLQIVELNRKDVYDIACLLRTQELREAESDGIDARHVAAILAGDWGFWRTVTKNLTMLPAATKTLGVGEADLALVERRIQVLDERIEAAPKSMSWRLRSRVGDRRKWYLEPEEIEHED